ncbi:MAG: NAD(P)/FAD-dependent oxidoreductase [bacterium]
MKYDVVVVGGGPAGLSAAYSAAKAGIRVAVLEKSKEIGYPIHTSGGSWIEELKQLDIPEKFMNPIYEGFFYSAKERAEFTYTSPPSCVLDVRGLYQYLAELAAAEGAEIFVNTTVLEPLKKDGKLRGVKARRHGKLVEISAGVTIDASGISAIIGRKTGLFSGFKRYGVGAEYDLFAPHWPCGRAVFLLGKKFVPSGYAWIFPHKNQRVRLGVGLIYPDSTGDPKNYLDQILNNKELFNGEFTNVSCLEYHVGRIPGQRPLQKTVADGLLVAGDAGGLISILLGEGIRFAIDIGRMAGETAAEAIRAERIDSRFLIKYERRWQKKYRRSFFLAATIHDRIAQYSDHDWDEKIRALAKVPADLIPPILKGAFTRQNLFAVMKASPALITLKILNTISSILKNA